MVIASTAPSGSRRTAWRCELLIASVRGSPPSNRFSHSKDRYFSLAAGLFLIGFDFILRGQWSPFIGDQQQALHPR